MKEINILNQDNEEKNFIKILLMGNKGVGKTSIKSIIFQQQLPKDTLRLAPTDEIEETRAKIMGNINLNLIDCCSKNEYIDKYFTTKEKKLFSKVDILIFVVDASDYNIENGLNYYKK
jgi:Ras-related GTP-binding protein A/B